jgi:hypothetical protein
MWGALSDERTGLSFVDSQLTVLLITFRHGPYRKQLSSAFVSNCCLANMLVYEEVTQQLLLYSYLLSGHCLATVLRATMSTILFSVTSQKTEKRRNSLILKMEATASFETPIPVKKSYTALRPIRMKTE